MLRSAQEDLVQDSQSSVRFDFHQQSSVSGQSVVQSDLLNQQEVIDVESPLIQSQVPFLAPVEKPVSPIRKRVQKCAAPLAAAKAKTVVPAKKPCLATTQMDQLETEMTTMKSSMDSFMAQMGTFMQKV